jgi:hypothetical protein
VHDKNRSQFATRRFERPKTRFGEIHILYRRWIFTARTPMFDSPHLLRTDVHPWNTNVRELYTANGFMTRRALWLANLLSTNDL